MKTCRARVSDAEVIVAPAEALPFPDQSFDAMLAQLVINLVADPEPGTREMRRVARPGGGVAACVWDANAMPLLSSFWEAAAQVAPDEVGTVDERKQVGLGNPSWLRDLWREAGLGEVSVGSLSAVAGYEDFDDLWYSFEHGVGRSGSVCLALDHERRARLRSRVPHTAGLATGTISPRSSRVVRAWRRLIDHPELPARVRRNEDRACRRASEPNGTHDGDVLECSPGAVTRRGGRCCGPA